MRPAEDSAFFRRRFDATVAWGLLFLLPPEAQSRVIQNVAAALNPGGKFLFTAPEERAAWRDALTGRESRSLGFEEYARLLRAEGLALTGADRDEGDNHYYFAEKPVGPSTPAGVC